jgi:hypothetical protein
MSKNAPQRSQPLNVTAERDTITLDRQFIFAGLRYGPGEYKVVDHEDEARMPRSQDEVNDLRIIPDNAAESIMKKADRANRREVARRVEAITETDALLPEDTPYLDELHENNVRNVGDVRRLGKQGLMSLKGIGEKKAEAILEHVEKLGEANA